MVPIAGLSFGCGEVSKAFGSLRALALLVAAVPLGTTVAVAAAAAEPDRWTPEAEAIALLGVSSPDLAAVSESEPLAVAARDGKDGGDAGERALKPQSPEAEAIARLSTPIPDLDAPPPEASAALPERRDTWTPEAEAIALLSVPTPEFDPAPAAPTAAGPARGDRTPASEAIALLSLPTPEFELAPAVPTATDPPREDWTPAGEAIAHTTVSVPEFGPAPGETIAPHEMDAWLQDVAEIAQAPAPDRDGAPDPSDGTDIDDADIEDADVVEDDDDDVDLDESEDSEPLEEIEDAAEEAIDEAEEAIEDAEEAIEDYEDEDETADETEETVEEAPEPEVAPAPDVEPPVAPTEQPEAAEEPRVLVAEVNVQGVEGELEDIVFDAAEVAPGRVTTRSRLQEDVNSIFATGFFRNVRVLPEDTPLGVRITFLVEPNPVLRDVEVVTLPRVVDARVLPEEVVEEIFSPDYGEILNLNDLQDGIDDLNQWYQDNGYDLAQVVGDPDIGPDGTVTLSVAEGVISDIRVEFFDEEGNPDEDPRTREFIVTREIELEPGDVYNVNTAQDDLQRVFGLGLFDDARLQFQPGDDPSTAVVVVELVEGNTGSIAAGAGFSSATGIFGTISYQEQNLGGNDQNLGAELQVGSRDLLFDVFFTDPWIAGDPYRTSYTVNAFRRRSISVIFDGGENEVELENGDRPRVRRTGGGVNFTRPLIKDPFDEADWTLSTGFQYQRVSIRDADGDLTPRDEEGNLLSFDDSGRDDLFTLSFGATRDRRDDPLNPTDGSFVRIAVGQTLPIGSGSILGTRLRGGYSHYFPVSLINFNDGPQALAFNVQAGTVAGDLPPYEAFALGGIDSVRGYDRGDVGSGRSFVQLTAEYRFPIINIIGAVLFVDYATDLGSGDTVPGDPAGVREKPGDGFGYGVGVRVNSPLGPIRVDFGINDEGDSRVHFGIGQRF